MGKMKDMLMDMCEMALLDLCFECDGDGVIEGEVARPQSFSRDIGELDVEEYSCPTCHGEQIIKRRCDCDNLIFKAYVNESGRVVINGADASKCEDCV